MNNVNQVDYKLVVCRGSFDSENAVMAQFEKAVQAAIDDGYTILGNLTVTSYGQYNGYVLYSQYVARPKTIVSVE